METFELMETFKKLFFSWRYWLTLVFTSSATTLLVSVPEESLNIKMWLAVFFLTKIGAISLAMLAFCTARNLFEEFEEND